MVGTSLRPLPLPHRRASRPPRHNHQSKGNLAATTAPEPAPPPPTPKLVAVTDAVIQAIPKEELLPLFFTTTTQEMFGVKGGVDVTELHPIKMIPKADILADMFTRAAVSDWAPAKQLVQVGMWCYPREGGGVPVLHTGC